MVRRQYVCHHKLFRVLFCILMSIKYENYWYKRVLLTLNIVKQYTWYSKNNYVEETLFHLIDVKYFTSTRLFSKSMYLVDHELPVYIFWQFIAFVNKYIRVYTVCINSVHNGSEIYRYTWKQIITFLKSDSRNISNDNILFWSYQTIK